VMLYMITATTIAFEIPATMRDTVQLPKKEVLQTFSH